MSFNLTNEFIDQTFQRLVQISGSNLVDGTGSVISNANITVENAASASYVEFSNVDNVPDFLLQSEFDTYTGSIDTFSGSISGRVTDLEQFSSSLVTTFATDADLTALSASLVTTIEGVDTRVDTLENKTLVSGSAQITLQNTLGNLSGSRIDGPVSTANTASYVEFSNVDNVPDFLLESEFNSFTGSFNTFSGSVSTEITELQQFSSSLDATFATDAELLAVSGALASSVDGIDTRVDTLENKTLVSGSSQIILQDTLGNLSGSRIDGSVTTADTASFVEFSDVNNVPDFLLESEFNAYTGSIDSLSGSISNEITSLQQFSSSLDATFATDAELTAVSASLVTTIQGVDTRVDTLENKTLVSGSSQITYSGINGIPVGIVSGSVQIVLQNTSGDLSGSRIDGSVTTANTASYVEFSNVDNVPDFLLESEFNTYTGSIDTLSGSISNEITSLQQFSSSLDATFATDAELSAVSASLVTTIQGVDTRVDTLENKTLVSGSSQITYSGISGIPVGIVSGSIQILLQDTTGNLSGSRIDGSVTTANTASYVEFSNVDNVPDFLLESEFNSFTGSFNTFSGSVSTEITSLQQFSSSLDATFATDAELASVSSSLNTSINLVSTNLNNISGSLSGRVTDLEAFSSSLDATFATDAELSALSGSLTTTIDGIDTRVDTLENKTLVSGSSQIILQDTLGNLSGSKVDGAVTTANTASYVEFTNVDNVPDFLLESEFNTYTGSIDVLSGSISNEITSLQQFSSSLDATFATDAELSAVSGALASTIEAVDTRVDTLENKTLVSGSSQITLQDALGDLSGSRIVGAVTTANTASYVEFSNVDNVPDFLLESEFNSFTGSFNSFSGSVSTEITELQQFSSSLDATFATDAELLVVSSSLDASITLVSTDLNTVSGSLSGRVTNLEAFSSSLDATFATDAELSAVSSSLSGSIATVSDSLVILSGSVSGEITSLDTRVDTIENKTLVSGSIQVILQDTLGNLSGSRIDGTVQLATSASHALNADNSTLSDFATTAGTANTASYVEFTNVDNVPDFLLESEFNTYTGSVDAFSGSFSTRITDLEQFSSSLDATFATDAELAVVSSSLESYITTVSGSLSILSGSVSGEITGLDTRVDTLENKTLVSGSSQIILQDTTGNLSGSRIDGEVASALSASFAVTASFALNGGASDSFKTIAVAGQSDVVADTSTDTLTLVAGTNVTITTDAGTDTITISSAATGSNAFPFTGSAGISGSLEVIGSLIVSGAIDTNNDLSIKEYKLGTNSADNLFLNSTGYPNLNPTGRMRFVNVVTPGSGYTPGTYANVPVIDLSGPPAVALQNVNVSVNASGVVSGVTVPGGQNTIVTSHDTILTVDTANIGGTGSGLSFIAITIDGFGNLMIGNKSGQSLTIGGANTALGNNALKSLTTGARNLAIGDESLTTTTTGISNIGIGTFTLNKNTTGSQNVAIGPGSLLKNTTGVNNTAIGPNSLRENTTASGNIGIGVFALGFNATGSNNTAIGAQALQSLTNGSNNTVVGRSAGLFTAAGNLTTANDNIFIGRLTGPNADNASNQIVIGHDIKGSGDNTVTLKGALHVITLQRDSFNIINGRILTRGVNMMQNPFNDDPSGNFAGFNIQGNTKLFEVFMQDNASFDPGGVLRKSTINLNVDTGSNLTNLEFRADNNGTVGVVNLRNDSGSTQLLVDVDEMIITGPLEVTGAVTGSFFTGSFIGEGSGLTNIISSSHALNADNAITASFVVGSATTGSNVFEGNQTITGSLEITGSVRGNVIPLSITSNTASVDFSTGNLFTLTLASGSDTHITSTGVGSGQTVSMLVTQDAATGSISFDSIFKFPSGSLYQANAVTGSEDILTFITFASTSSIYVNSVTTLE